MVFGRNRRVGLLSGELCEAGGVSDGGGAVGGRMLGRGM